jgi:hypothetical protein
MIQGDVEFKFELDPILKSATWLQSENLPNFSTSGPVTTSGSVMSLITRFEVYGEVALEGPSAVSGADPGAEDEGVAAIEGDGWLDDDGSRRVRHEIFGEIPYLARYLSVF